MQKKPLEEYKLKLKDLLKVENNHDFFTPINCPSCGAGVLAEIDQWYVKTTGEDASSNMIVNGADGQKHVAIAPLMVGKSKVRFLEQEIEKYLKIEDRKVPEES